MSPGLGDRARALLCRALPTPSEVVGAGGGLEEEGEDIEVLTLDFDEALAMTADGRISDAKTVILLQWAALHLFCALLS